jgi:hypothetical protein
MEHRAYRRAFEEYMATGAKADPDPALHVVNGMAEFYARGVFVCVFVCV